MNPRCEITPQKTARRMGVFKLSTQEQQDSQLRTQKLRDYIAPGVRRDLWKREMDQGDPTAAMDMELTAMAL